jgi:uncharacterized protein (TIGR02246 family)
MIRRLSLEIFCKLLAVLPITPPQCANPLNGLPKQRSVKRIPHMNNKIAWLIYIAAFFTSAVTVGAQTKADEEAIRRLPLAFSEAWAKHDGHALAQVMAEEGDFVSVGATWFHGRRDFETYHTRVLSGRFKNSTLTPLETAVSFLRPDLAIVRWSWSVETDKNTDGSPRPKRFGLMTMLAERRDGKWLVIAAQNTNSAPSVSPEAEGIVMPIEVPLSLDAPPKKP